jgi:hypothetical protein
MPVREAAAYDNHVRDAKEILQEILKIRLPALVTQTRGEGLPPFFKNGVELVNLKVVVGPVEVGLILAGPEPRDTQGSFQDDLAIQTGRPSPTEAG